LHIKGVQHVKRA